MSFSHSQGRSSAFHQLKQERTAASKSSSTGQAVSALSFSLGKGKTTKGVRATERILFFHSTEILLFLEGTNNSHSEP